MIPILLPVLMLLSCQDRPAAVHTRGIGVYPGDPAECFAPEVVPGGSEYRNLSLMRAASHSSAYDYNLTAQLVTDGIVPSAPAPWAELSVNGTPVEKRMRHYLNDMNVSRIDCPGPEARLRLDFHGYAVTADRILVAGDAPEGTVVTVEGVPGEARSVPTKNLVGKNDLILHAKEWELALPSADSLSGVSVCVRSPREGEIAVNEIFFYRDGKVVDALPNAHFSSSWKSLGAENEWVAVDLGGISEFNRMVFHWLNPPLSGRIQASVDGKRWRDVAPLPASLGEMLLPRTRGRYVRVCLDATADGQPFELGEWEVWGTGGVSCLSAPAAPRTDSRQRLSGGGWKLLRASQTDASGEEISSEGFDDSSWMVATVPGTVLGSYVNAGAVPDPNKVDNQLFISDSYFRSDFWYRDTFEAAPSGSERQFLQLRGVNHRAEIWLNGRRAGRLDGAFRSKSFDVTGILRDGRNDLAVRIFCNEHYGTAKEQNAYTPDSNGGLPGADNPTMHATIGWDWIPTVRGRNIGLYDEVSLLYTGPVTLEDPFVRTTLPLPDTTSATVYASVRLRNHSDRPVTGVLRWSFGTDTLTRSETLDAGEDRIVTWDPFILTAPRLWWPRGYGSPELYDVCFVFETEEGVSDSTAFRTGVRQMDYKLEAYEPLTGCPFEGRDNNRRLSLYVNGRRFIGFGGNWGFPEHLLNYRAREYDIAVGNHAAMNFTLIRNWVGMTDHPAFYEACDRYGVMVWQDFWLANPWDGPDPADPSLFNQAAEEYVRRIRNHPSLALYVGRNEGYPPAEIDRFLEEMTAREHPGMYYISHSAADGVNGGGPYHALPAAAYYTLHGKDKLHSERGMPNVMNYENLVRSIGKEHVEPFNSVAHPNAMYGLHDYALGREGYKAAQQAESFNELLVNAFGEPVDAEEFTRLAQWVNYEGYRAMFEGRSEYRRGLILWMSHPAWPSMVWQTYDYYFEPTGAWFGCRKACESVHILLNALTGNVDVVNYRAGNLGGLTASAVVYDLAGKEVRRLSETLDIQEDDTRTCFALEVPSDISEVYFVRLRLSDASGRILSENFYTKGREEGNLRSLRTLPKARLSVSAAAGGSMEDLPGGIADGREVILTQVTVTNRGGAPVPMIRLKTLDRHTGDLVLPVWYTDNYFALMGGESRTVTVCVRREDCSGVLRFAAEPLIQPQSQANNG